MCLYRRKHFHLQSYLFTIKYLLLRLVPLSFGRMVGGVCVVMGAVP